MIPSRGAETAIAPRLRQKEQSQRRAVVSPSDSRTASSTAPQWQVSRCVGPGAATLIGTLIIIEPQLILGVLLVWASILVTTGFVGLATMAAATSLPVWLAFTRLPEDQPLFIYLAVMAGCIIYWHRANIERMRTGTEHRNTKLMLFRRQAAKPDDDQP